MFDYLLLGLYPSPEDMAAMREGKAKAPIGTPRRALDIALPGQLAPAAAAQPAVDRVAAAPAPMPPQRR